MKTRFVLALALFLSSTFTPLSSTNTTNNASANVGTPTPALQPTSPETSADWLTEIQNDIQGSEYIITWQNKTYLPDVPTAYQAPNRAHNFRTYFTASGLRLIPRQTQTTPEWEWGLTLNRYGYSGALSEVSAATLTASDTRIEYQRGALTEWYLNNESGLEQGFTLDHAPINPQATSELILELTLSGNLEPVVIEAEAAIDFLTQSGVRVLRYDSLLAYDATGRALPARLALSGDTIQLIVDATDAVYPVTIDPLATTPNWTAESNQADAWLGWAVNAAGDVNGDGYSDVIVSAPNYDNGQANEGRVSVYHGSPAGLSSTADWTAESNVAGAMLGYEAKTTGDTNGDGYSDIVAGATGYSNGQTNEGAAFIWYGSPTGLGANGTPSNADWVVESNQAGAAMGSYVGQAGDVNGDGYSDVLVAAYLYDNGQTDEGRVFVYHGSALGPSNSPNWMTEDNRSTAWLGAEAGAAGDINGDGYGDIVVGSPGNGTYPTNIQGYAYAFYGSATGLSLTPNWTVTNNQPLSRFGGSVGTAGDVNGDGYADVLVSAHWYDGGAGFAQGKAYLYYGNAAGLSLTPNWTAQGCPQSYCDFGTPVRTAGDVNGDGYADVIIGLWLYDNGQASEGAAFVYYGSSTGLSASPDWQMEGQQAGSGFGGAVGTAGDVNGDGYADIIIGAYGYDNGQSDEGRAFVYHGSPSGLSATANWTQEGQQTGAGFGHGVDTAGDVNGDGYADVIVGAPQYDNGQIDEGRAYVYLGSPDGLNPTPNWIAEGDQAGAAFGYTVGAANDVNGDGYSDIIIGASGYTNGQVNEGAAFVWYGSANGLGVSGSPSNADWQAESNQASAAMGVHVGSAGDVNGDGYADVIVAAFLYDGGQTDEGRVYVYHGSAQGPSPTPNWFTEDNRAEAWLGHEAGSAGDINGDGYSDIIVGSPGNGSYPTSSQGYAYAFYGSATGLSSNPDWTVTNDQPSSRFGTSVNTAGDVNGDGYADVIVGAQWYDAGAGFAQGKVYVYYGTPSGLSPSASWTAQECLQSYCDFGVVVRTAGDVNGDGFADILVGAWIYDNGQSNEGAAFVYHGSASGLSNAPNWSAEGNQNNAGFGRYLNTAGDVNGDGYADVIVGSIQYDNGQTDEGAAFVYYGGSDNVSGNTHNISLNPRQRQADDTSPIAHLGASASNAFRLAALGRTPFGRGQVKLEWEVKPLGALFDGTSTQQSATWLDTGTAGAQLNELVSNLASHTVYHWRIRLLYHPVTTPFQQHSRWLTNPWNGWQESRLRTSNPPSIAGNALVFARPQPEVSSDADVWIMNADGSDETQLTIYPGEDRMPVLSPEGTKVAYMSVRGGLQTLWVMNSDGTNPVQLAIAGNTQRLDWSPDGTQLAITNDSVDWWEIWVINANGTNPYRLTTHAAAAGEPNWSPDAQKILYGVNPATGYKDLYTVNSDGTGQTLLISASSSGFSHAMAGWSPDGAQIATIRWPAGSTIGPYDLWLMNADGTNGHTLVQNIDQLHLNRLSWSKDGNWIVFAKNGQVWRVRKDGTGLTQINSSGWEPHTNTVTFGLPACSPQYYESDIALILDRSSSMNQDNKIGAAKAALSAFITDANAPPDQLALASFALTATLNQQLTTDKAAMLAAVQAITTTSGTRIDLGLHEARVELNSARHIPSHRKIMILLGDGQQSGGNNQPVLDEANAAKAEGVIIYTIGLGIDADQALLTAVATSPQHYYYAPTGDDLAEIYALISTALACPNLGGQVFVDTNLDGQYTPGADQPLVGITVNLTGLVISQTISTSQADGNYLFPGLLSGTYTVLVDIPLGYMPTTAISYVVPLNVLDDLDNNFGFSPPNTPTPTATATHPSTLTPTPTATACVPMPSPLLTGLIAYWKLDETSGTRIDSTGRGNNLTDHNTVSYAGGKIGNAAQFVATNQEYLSHADNTDLSTGDIDYTFAGWTYLDAPPLNGAFIAKGNADYFGTMEYGLGFDAPYNLFGGSVTYGGGGANVHASTLGAPSGNQWYFIVFWHDSVNNQAGISVNGVEDIIAYSGGGWDTGFDFILGSDTCCRYWNGRIDETGIWKRVLTASERAMLYNNGAGITYPFDSGAGTCPTPTTTPTLTRTPTPTGSLSPTFTPTATRTPTATPVPACFTGPWIYRHDFQSSVGTEWSSTATSYTPSGRRFLGQFNNQTVSLILTGLPAHTQLNLCFDLYVIRSWDGNMVSEPGLGLIGPDHWSLGVLGQPTLFDTTFTNWANYQQSYPDAYPSNHPAYTSAREVGTLGYTYDNQPMDSVYRIQATLEHTDNFAVLSFSASGLQDLADEGWGIDNIEVITSQNVPLGPHVMYMPLVKR